jgi:hypothetical protein
LLLRKSPFDGDVLTFRVTEIAQSVAKGIEELPGSRIGDRRGKENPDPRAGRRLLCVRRARSSENAGTRGPKKAAPRDWMVHGAMTVSCPRIMAMFRQRSLLRNSTHRTSDGTNC